MTPPVGAEPSQAEIEAARERLLMTHPSWFKRLSLKTNRSTDEARYSATTLADVALTAALPLVEARIRAELADEIEALRDSDQHHERCSLTEAAAIVRGQS